jgi:hypothetical protein
MHIDVPLMLHGDHDEELLEGGKLEKKWETWASRGNILVWHIYGYNCVI